MSSPAERIPDASPTPFPGRLYSISPYGNLSGAPVSALNHAAGMARYFESVCLVLPQDGPLRRRAAEAGIPVCLWPVVNRGLRRGWFRRALFRDLRDALRSRWRFFRGLCRALRRAPGLMHVHSSVSIAPLALAAARWCGVPAVLHVRESVRSAGDRCRVRLLAMLARRVVCVSDGARRGYGRAVRRRARVIHNFMEMPSAPPPRNPHPPVVAMVARMSRAKGTDLFLDMCVRLRDAGQDFRARMVGNWPDEGERAAARAFLRDNGLEPQVEVLSMNPEMDAIYGALDVLVLPTRRDSFPRVVMEAMGYGIPVVASRVDGIPEMVEDGVTGCLVEPEDVDGFVAAVARLLQHPEQRRQMGAAGRERARRLFAPEAYRAAMLELYRPLLPRRPGRDAGGDP